MKAAVLKSPFQIEVMDIPKPSVTSGDVLVAIRATAVCGTDVAIYAGKHTVNLPLVMGHETTGEVIAVGERVTKIHMGDRVVIDPTIFCGICSFCRSGKSNLCREGGLMGRESQGSYAEFAVVPETRVFLLPKNISYEDGTTLVALATLVSAQRKLPFLAGSSVAILGMGVTGLLHLQLAKLSGASPIVVISRSGWKLDLARRFRADVIVNAREQDPTETVMAATDGKGVDVAIESTGSIETIRQSIDMTRAGGIILQFGVGPKSADGLDFSQIYYKELAVLGSRALTSRDMEVTLRLAFAGAIDLNPFVTHRFRLDETAKALEFIYKQPGSILRAVIQTS